MNITPSTEFGDEQKHLIEALRLVRSDIQSAVIKGGDIMVKLVTSDPQIIDKLCLKYPEDFNEWFLEQFLKVGQGKLLPEVLTSKNPKIQQLASMPVEFQKKLLSEPVKVVHLSPPVDGAEPQVTHVMKKFVELEPEERRRAVTRTGENRPEAEQVAILRREATAKAAPALARIPDYEVNKRERTLEVNVATTFSVDLLLRILRDHIGLTKRELKFLGDGK